MMRYMERAFLLMGAGVVRSVSVLGDLHHEIYGGCDANSSHVAGQTHSSAIRTSAPIHALRSSPDKFP